jgi:uncharacterized protein YdhG (YjbR/CyaY superfamily)
MPGKPQGGRPSKRPAKAATVDAYLAAVPEDFRVALENLRKVIRGAAPDATERIGYAIPMFYQRGPLVSFAAFQDHCSFYVMSPAVMDAFQVDLKRYETSKGTIRFTPAKPLPASLVKKLVKARIAENEAK